MQFFLKHLFIHLEALPPVNGMVCFHVHVDGQPLARKNLYPRIPAIPHNPLYSLVTQRGALHYPKRALHHTQGDSSSHPWGISSLKWALHHPRGQFITQGGTSSPKGTIHHPRRHFITEGGNS